MKGPIVDIWLVINNSIPSYKQQFTERELMVMNISTIYEEEEGLRYIISHIQLGPKC